MKTLKLNNEKSLVSREVVSKVGETFYACQGVKAVRIEVTFIDGSNIGFKRHEIEDELNESFREE